MVHLNEDEYKTLQNRFNLYEQREKELKEKVYQLQKENEELSEQLEMWVNPEIPTEMERLKKENKELKAEYEQYKQRVDNATDELERIKTNGELREYDDKMFYNLIHTLFYKKERSNEK